MPLADLSEYTVGSN